MHVFGVVLAVAGGLVRGMSGVGSAVTEGLPAQRASHSCARWSPVLTGFLLDPLRCTHAALFVHLILYWLPVVTGFPFAVCSFSCGCHAVHTYVGHDSPDVMGYTQSIESWTSLKSACARFGREGLQL